jgi:Sec-independent protein secretion pathway component TatC
MLLLVSLLSPTDIMSFILLLLPLWLFYELCIWIYLYEQEYRKKLKKDV